jgi:hypothetical protein
LRATTFVAQEQAANVAKESRGHENFSAETVGGATARLLFVVDDDSGR